MNNRRNMGHENDLLMEKINDEINENATNASCTESTAVNTSKQKVNGSAENVRWMKHDVSSDGSNNGDVPRSLDNRQAEYHDNMLSRFHETALNQVGTGMFQYLMFLVIGLCIAGDSTELLVVSYVMPSAEVDLCMTNIEKAWLASATFLGMILGAVLCGVMSDLCGRKLTLLLSTFINLTFGIAAVFMTSYSSFVVCRLFSGIGIGGSLPISFAYFCEFLTQKKRGKFMSLMLAFWAIGGIFTASVAWLLLSNKETTISSIVGGKAHWRKFLLVCNTPMCLVFAALWYLPESPRYLLDRGRETEALAVYQQIYKWNQSERRESYKMAEISLPHFRRQSKQPVQAAKTSALKHMFRAGIDIYASILDLFQPLYRRTTLALIIVWFMSAFGYYGMSMWLPELIKVIKSQEQTISAEKVENTIYTNKQFEHTLTNTQFENVSFIGCGWKRMVISHSQFNRCTFVDNTFADVHLSRTNLVDSYLKHNVFNRTNVYPTRMHNCSLEENVWSDMRPKCKLDFDYNLHITSAFEENFIGQLALLPGSLFAAWAIDKIGRTKLIAYSMIVSSAVSLFVWLLKTQVGVIIFEALFNFIFISGWNGLDILTTEVYPTRIRTTGYGLISAISRVAGVLGTLTFGKYIETTLAVPMLITVAILLLGGMIAFRLPETRDTLV